MTQREATVSVIEFIRDQGEPATRELKQALKVLEKRAEVLRVRYERRHATVADDLKDEPVTEDEQFLLGMFRGIICPACQKPKPYHYWFCERCFDKVDPQTRRALRGVTHDLWPQAFCRAMRQFREGA